MKTAIVLYGYLRTWNLCKDSIIDTMNMLCGNDKDWFISLWNTTTSTQDDVNNYLKYKNQNIVSSRWVDTDDNLLIEYYKTNSQNYSRAPGSSIGPAYLRQLISLDKRKHEYKNNIKYDKVLFIRSDVVYYTNGMSVLRYNDQMKTRKEDLALQLAGDFHDNYYVGGPSANDMVPIGGMLSSDIYSHMYLDFTPPHDLLDTVHLRGGMCPHAALSQLTNTHLIRSRNDVSSYQYIAPRIIRPNSNINQILAELTTTWDGNMLSYDGPQFEDYNTWLRQPFNNFTDEIKMCKSLGIDLKDYGINNI
jgi:hypothetical protein